MDVIRSCEHFFIHNKSSGGILTNFQQFQNNLKKRLQSLQPNSLRYTVKFLRKKLKLNKSPKKKGYEQFLTEEEKRYYEINFGL